MRGRANNIGWLLCVLLLLVAACTTAAGQIIYVDADATGANNGSSWADAFNYLQDAITTASAGDEIRVAQGIYKPNQGLLPIPVSVLTGGGHGGGRTEIVFKKPSELGQNATFKLKNGVMVKGGFAGFGKDNPNAHDVELYETTLSGDLNGDDIEVSDPWDLRYEPTRAENSYHVVSSSGNEPNAILDGFVVTSGNAYFCKEQPAGGGILITDSSPAITNCKLIYNSALSGGAISIYEGEPNITNCRFIMNSAIGGPGGGVYCSRVDLTLKGCVFVNNYAEDGGGMHIWGNVVLTGCIFSHNTAENTGGGVVAEGATLKLNECKFSGNSACTGSGMATNHCIITAVDCVFTDNTMIPYIANTESPLNRNCGGGLYMHGGHFLLAGCVFTGNSSANGGGIFCDDTDNATMTDCLFTRNVADESGGALYNSECNPDVSRCIFSGNQAEQGGAIYGMRYGPNLISCTLFGNSAQNGNAVAWDSHTLRAGGILPFSMFIANCILWNGGDEIGQRNGKLPDITVTYSDIQGGWPGEGNIDADPCFAEPGYWDTNGTPRYPIEAWVDGDYHLKSQAGRWTSSSASWVKDDVTSPCIDAGDPSSPVGFEPFPNGGVINMGAYGGTAEASKSYFGGPVCETIVAGDINGDCKVDFADFALMAAHWFEDNTR